ncbi:MAG TPA: thiamine pyrophosphate-dependent dehydrogenase E1 component subunit alpha [Polyangia bacterium]|nr:thiamine pyrophosphate-dependent dehydrogenase E1 component subunit alpha [Polyangia bacterium]
MKLEVIRVMDDEGRVIHPEREPKLSGDELRKLFRTITLIRVLDERMLRLQRQGRLGFYLSSIGEEATHIGAACALRPTDWLYPAYREVGAALYRGYDLRTFMCQMFGNALDPVRGRQMPVHHTVRKLNFVTISSPVATQIPHAVGTAWASKLEGKDDVALAFFGEGGTSTPIFHSSLNLAGVMKVPAILMCRNNGWAISVPRSVQTASLTFAQKAIAYGLPGVLVDGNDILAVIHAVSEAAARGRRGEGATFIEARTYRRGAHSSSDDPSVYREPAEPKEWERRDPLDRLRKYMLARGEISAELEQQMRAEANEAITDALEFAEKQAPKPPLHSMFEDVTAHMDWRLREEQAELDAEIAKHGPKAAPHG